MGDILVVAIVNLFLFAAAAGSLFLSVGCGWASQRLGSSWLRGVAAGLLWAARAATALLVLAVLISAALFSAQFLGYWFRAV